MSSPVSIITLASDAVVLGVAVSIVGVVLKSLSFEYEKYLPAPIKAILSRSQNCVGEGDDLI